MNHDNDNHTGLRFLSVCSGIEAASVAFGPLGWKAVAFSEIEPAPCSVLAHHYPDVPNHGDMTKFKEWPDYGKDGSEPIDLVCGGTPCQAFSVAGLREGLNDPRGNLSLTFLAIVDKYRPKWVLFENVPGILSSATHVSPDPRPPEIDLDGDNGPGDGEEVVVSDEYEADESHAFSCFLAGLSELGYGVAYRVIDAQYVRVDGFERAVPQRRRRVFVVGYLGDWRRAAAVLLEPESMSGNPAPSRKAGQKPAPTLSARTKGGGGLGTDFELDGGLVPFGGNNTSGPIEVATAVNAHGGPHGRMDFESETFIATPYTLAIRGRGDSHNLEWRQDGTANAILTPNGGRAGIGVGAVAFDTTQITSKTNRSNPQPGDPCHTLAKGADAPAIAYRTAGDGNVYDEGDVTAPLTTGTDPSSHILSTQWAVRRLTPVECARLQGFPDDYLSQVIHNGKPLADGPMYKGLGNSWPVNSVRWIGRRIQMVEEIAAELDAANTNTIQREAA